MKRHADIDQPFWTTGRALRWLGLFLLLMIGMPVVIGFSAAYAGKVWPDGDWRTIGRTTALLLFVLGTLIGTWRLWVAYRRHVTAGAADGWERRAAEKRLAISGIWRDCALVGLVMGMAGTLATVLPAGPPRLALGVAAALALAYALVRGSVYYMRAVDEQERDANLWGGYCGMTVYAALFFTQHLAGRFGVAVPHVHEAIFAIALVVTAAVYGWKRFR